MDQMYVPASCVAMTHPDLIVADNNMYRYYNGRLYRPSSACRADTELANLGFFETLKYLNCDVVASTVVTIRRVKNDPLPFQTSSGTSAVGGAPLNNMFFLNDSVSVH